jgi:REP element-mobilizing transposase RayT
MVEAYHAIFGTYGFWLPNDPRGSWSDFIGAWELLRFGEATGHERITRSVAHTDHDRQLRLAAKAALKYPPVIFNGVQARSAGLGFAVACEKSGYKVLACSILPEHVHVVIRRHRQTIEQMVGHLKGRATQQMVKESVHPLGAFFESPDPPLTPWAENCWKVFLNDNHDIERAVRYVEDNPIREGLRPQHWTFVERRTGITRPNGGQARRLN